MDGARHGSRYVFYGQVFALVGAVAFLQYLRTRRLNRLSGSARAAKNSQDPKDGTPVGHEKLPRESTSTAAPQPPAREKLKKHELASWAASLRKSDTAELPVLLEWTEQLLSSEGGDPADEALAACLAALQQLAPAGARGGMKEHFVALALKASSIDLDRSLEILNGIFKGSSRCQQGHPEVEAVVELAMKTLKEGLEGTAERGSYQRAVRLLHFVAEESQGRSLLSVKGGPALVLSAMEKLQDDPGVMLEGCSCLLCLASDTRLDVGRAVSVAILSMKSYRQNGELQWRALATLYALPHWDSGDLALEVTQLACTAADQHPRFDAVVEYVAKVLCRLVGNKDSGVLSWLKTEAPKGWLKRFRDLPHGIRKPNKEAERWAAELWRLCSK